MITLSKEQATLVADDILAANAPSARRLNFLRGFLPLAYRFPELSSLQPWQQALLARSAAFSADKSLPVILSFLPLLLGILACAFLLPPQYQTFLSFATVLLVLAAPALLVRRAHIRRNLQVLLAARGFTQ